MTTTVESSSGESSRLDLSRILTFFFEDPNWVPKLLVGSLFAFLSPLLIGTVFVVGYAVVLAKRTMAGQDSPLPEWDDLSGLFLDGLKGMAISLAYKIPILVLSIIMILAMFGGVFLHGESGTIPSGMMTYGLPIIFGGWLFVFVLTLAILIYLPAAFVRFVQTDRLGAAFEVMENIAFIREHQSSYLMALIGISVVTFIAQFGLFVFCIGIFPAAFWSACAMGYVVGELARLEATATPAEDVPA